MIQARLSKRYPAGGTSAGFSLDVDLRASDGITAVFGPTAAGKTLLLDIIAGFLRPDTGRILLDDEILFDAGSGVNRPPQRRHCSYVFRQSGLFPHMTLRDNLVFAAERTPRLERHRRVSEALERFRLADVSGRRPHEVSTAECERCVVARAVIGGPRLLLLDDPWRGLDAPLRRDLRALLRSLRPELKIPIVLATSDLEECFELAEDLRILSAGRILQSGAPRAVADQPASVEAARLLGMTNLFEAQILALDPGRNTSRLRVQEHELHGAYFPGHLIGDRVWLCVRGEDLRLAVPDGSRPGVNQVPARLLRVSQLPHSLRLEFSGGISTDVPRHVLAGYEGQKDWLIEFPAEALRVL